MKVTIQMKWERFFFADAIFRTSKIDTAAVYTVANYFRW